MYLWNSASNVCYILRSQSQTQIIGKCLSFVDIPPSDQNGCVISRLYMRVFYPSVCVGRLVHRHIIHRSPFGSDGNRCISVPSPTQFCLYSIYFYLKSILFSWEILCFPTAYWIVRAKTSARMFPNVAEIQLICLINSLITKVTANRGHL